MSTSSDHPAQHGELEPAHSLVYRGLAADASLDTLIPLLGKLLRLSSQDTQIALKHPPLHLAHSRQRDRLRQHQMGLARLGCISSLETAWQYRDWTLPKTLKDSFDLAPEDRRAFAMLQVDPPPGHTRLSQAAERLDTPHFYTLNHSQVLLESPGIAGSGTGRWLGNLQAQLHSALSRGSSLPIQVRSAITIWPDDGHLLADVLDHLAQQLESTGVERGEKPVTVAAVSVLPARLFAGGAINKLHANEYAEPPHLDKLTQAQALELTRHWPIHHQETFGHTPVTPQGDPSEVFLRYRSGEATRLDRCRSLLSHFAKLDKLPSLPSVAMKAYQLVQQDDGDSQELAQIVEQDPSLSSRILTMVNSTYYGLRSKVDSISHALVIVGRDELAHLAMHLSCETVFRGLGGKTAQALWNHSALTAEIARDLASEHSRCNPSTVYTAALLHDVGKIFLHSFASTDMQQIDVLSQAQSLPSYELERERFGHDHASLGAALLRRWGLPNHLCDYVGQHHGPLPGEASISTEAALIGLADHIAHLLTQSEPQGDALRLRRSHAAALSGEFAHFTPEAIELLAEDMRGRRRRSNLSAA